jgi:hypothetical protein
MWSERFGKEIASVLNLMADMPNVVRDGEISVFDGGRREDATGITTYEFSDGSQAIYSGSLNLRLTIRFSSGTEVNIECKNLPAGGFPLT